MSNRKLHWLRSVRTRLVTMAVATAAIFFMPLANASGYDDFDARDGAIEPDATQLSMVSTIGASASWSRLGTPSSLLKYGDYLATGLSGTDAATVARSWVDANKALFRLSSVDSLKVMSDAAFPWSEAYAVTFRQEIGALQTAEDGLLIVGIVGNATDGWKIAYASATTTADTSLSGNVTLSAADAYVIAAQNIGRQLHVTDIANTKIDGEWSTFSVSGFGEPQRARMRALPTPNNGVRPVYETVYIENAHSSPRAYMHYIDAENGTVWMRKDIVEQSHPTFEAFTGELPDDGFCDDAGPWEVEAGETVGTVIASVTANIPVDDATIAIIRDGEEVAFFDSGFSPEAVNYSPGDDGVGVYHVRVCDFNGAGNSNTWLAGYTGTVTFLEQEANAEGIPLPKWKVFAANPHFKGHPAANTDTRELWCWEDPANACDLDVFNFWSRVPWDYDANMNAPTFTTRGNNAFASLSESPLTPSVPYQPIATDRDYSFDWQNTWGVNACNIPASVLDSDASPGPDVDEAVVNLFAMHNRAHDWSYALGFTESRWNAQSSNFGNSGLGNDPVIGNAQAGGLAGGFPAYVGRDNANMITLPDGVSPITNMYLWQPIAGAFYAPCADGDFDAAIIFHEYGHMTENRMIGKGGTRSGHHAGAMGESFGDFSAAEYLNEYSTVPLTMDADDDPFALAGFSTGNGVRGIRNYNMNSPRTGGFPEPGLSTTGSGEWQGTLVNPLNFGNMGYDLTGRQVHADGEIWSATNMTVRQYLVEKYNALGYLDSNELLQKECADGERSPSECPGNRRWIQTVFDAMLLMPPNTTMLQARDAYLMADQMRYDADPWDNTNQKEIWLAFAHRGMGDKATAAGSAINDAIEPDFSSPEHDNAKVKFEVFDEFGQEIENVNIFVGHFEARSEPIVDKSGDSADFAPGDYEFVAQARGYGHVRFAATFVEDVDKTIKVTMPINHASSASGATIASATAPGSSQTGALIDDTESSNYDWAVTGAAVDVVTPQVTVALAGPRTIKYAQVSAMLLSQNRFTALREFELQTSTDGLIFDTWIESGPDAFPGHTPRPVSPELILRSFEGDERDGVTHVRIIALNNQCTGNELFQDDDDGTTIDHDNDANNTTNCRFGVPAANAGVIILGEELVLGGVQDEVHIAELQVFTSKGGSGGGGNGGGNGDNECADDVDSDYKDCRVRGEGTLDSDGDDAEFKIETKQKNGEVDGKLYFDTEGPMRKVRGTPDAQSIDGSHAEITGTCEYEYEDEDKVPCNFTVIVDDTNPDSFSIEIEGIGIGLPYSASGQVIDGDIVVRTDDP